MDPMSRRKMEEQSSMFNWFPIVNTLQIPQPATILMWFDNKSKVMIVGDSIRYTSTLKQRLMAAAAQLGYPLFMRTDQTSGKHAWKGTCYVESEDRLLGNLAGLIEYSENAGFFGLPLGGIVLREYVPMKSTFTAFNGMPIAPERRYFIRDGSIQCKHPYWPADAMRFYGKEPKNWKKELEAMSKVSMKDEVLLDKYALMVAEKLEGYWSVDFCKAKDGRWMLIDMARGEVSFHWKDCKVREVLED